MPMSRLQRWLQCEVIFQSLKNRKHFLRFYRLKETQEGKNAVGTQAAGVCF